MNFHSSGLIIIASLTPPSLKIHHGVTGSKPVDHVNLALRKGGVTEGLEHIRAPLSFDRRTLEPCPVGRHPALWGCYEWCELRSGCRRSWATKGLLAILARMSSYKGRELFESMDAVKGNLKSIVRRGSREERKYYEVFCL